jgi:hypothetical protein
MVKLILALLGFVAAALAQQSNGKLYLLQTRPSVRN